MNTDISACRRSGGRWPLVCMYMCVVSLCVHVYYAFVYVCPCAHACVCVCTGGGKGTGGSNDIFIFAEQQIYNTKRSSQQLKS